MTITRKLFTAAACAIGILSMALAQNPAPKRLAPPETASHLGETAVVCGAVVDTSIVKHGHLGIGFPVSFYLDQPQSSPVFYFVAFGTPKGGPEEVIAAYKGKRVCVTGEIETLPAGGAPFILAADRSHIKPQPAAK
jgi:hypothetical protein